MSAEPSSGKQKKPSIGFFAKLKGKAGNAKKNVATKREGQGKANERGGNGDLQRSPSFFQRVFGKNGKSRCVSRPRARAAPPFGRSARLFTGLCARRLAACHPACVLT